jgi:hypothetical protein
MSERIGFALLLLVAMGSVASMLFITGASSTANVVVNQPPRGLVIDLCSNVRCPGHVPAEAYIDAHGRIIHDDRGNAVCICPAR